MREQVPENGSETLTVVKKVVARAALSAAMKAEKKVA
jgi:hypothetical protein